MRDVTYTRAKLATAAGLTPNEAAVLWQNALARKLTKWVCANMVRLVEDCPYCGADVDSGELHSMTCEHGLEEWDG